LRWALRFLMSRVERGMTVELKLGPPKPEPVPAAEGEEVPAKAAEEKQVFEQLLKSQNSLLFSGIMIGQPILELERPANDALPAAKSPNRIPKKKPE
jgi:hypothetical protein